jgi:xanthine dehydrogenase accessory factor
MNAQDLDVLDQAIAWSEAGRRTHLLTIVSTWGSAPRQPGALLALRDDGRFTGSLSGGCLEESLVGRAHAGAMPLRPAFTEYGTTREEADRLRIPCGGRLGVVCEPLTRPETLRPAREAVRAGRLITRRLDLATGEAVCLPFDGRRQPSLADGRFFSMAFGPKWRLLVIGANQVAEVLAQFARLLDFQVLVCDPREEMRSQWRAAEGTAFVDGMPDDAVLAIRADVHTAIVAVTHDPRLDDMALMQALKSEAFYVGALGSHGNQRKRRGRLACLDLSAQEIARLHGPIGLPIHSRTPAEIAVSILGEIVKERGELAMGVGSHGLPHRAEVGGAAPGLPA